MSESGASLKDSLPEVYIDDILMSLKYFLDEEEAHIKIKDSRLCASCDSKPCVQICPAGAYRAQDDGTVQIASQSCVECGSCRIMCPKANLAWKLPRGGFGVSYKFG